MKITNTTPHITALKELGVRLARIRKQQGLTQQVLSQQAGIGVATLRRIEDGKDAHIGSWIKLLNMLGMTASIDNLLPDAFNSPMAEVKAANKKRRVTTDDTNVSGVEENRVVWGDEQ